jgi:hypothetical protein
MLLQEDGDVWNLINGCQCHLTNWVLCGYVSGGWTYQQYHCGRGGISLQVCRVLSSAWHSRVACSPGEVLVVKKFCSCFATKFGCQ